MAPTPLQLHILRRRDTLVMYFMESRPWVRRHRIQFDDGLLTNTVEELGRLTNLANTRLWHPGDAAPALLPTAQELRTTSQGFQTLGELIFQHFFPDTIRQKLRSTRARDLALYLDDQVVHVPWELAFDGEDFLLAKFRIGRQVLADDPDPLLLSNDPRAEDPLVQQRSEQLRMLIITDPTGSLEAVDDEAEQLLHLLDAYKDLEVDVKGGPQLRKIDLLQALEVYDLVHYAGHAFFDPVNPDGSGWVLHDTILTARELRNVKHPPLLVFANACQSGVIVPPQGDSPPQGQAYEQAAFGIGSAFLHAGVQNYIGTFCVIHDASSAAFAANFYRHFMQGASIGEALAVARQQARQEPESSGLLWASYMHYGDPTFRFATATAPPPPPPAPDKPETPPPPLTPPPRRWRKPPWVIAGGLLGLAGLLFVWRLFGFWPWCPLPPDCCVSTPLTVAFLPCAGEPLEHRIAPILHASGRVKMVEREHLDKLIEELQLNPRYIDRATGLRLGRMLAARLIAFCTFNSLQDGRVLSVHMAETETRVNTVWVTEAVETSEALDGAIKQLASDLLRQIRQMYPIQGRMTDVTPQGVLLNIGTDQGVTVGLTLDVFGTGEPLPVERPIGQVVVTEVATRHTRAKVARADIPLQRGWRAREAQQQ